MTDVMLLRLGEREREEKVERDGTGRGGKGSEEARARTSRTRSAATGDLAREVTGPEIGGRGKRFAKKYMRKNMRTFNAKLQFLAPQECFQAVVDDRTHTILLVPQDGLDINAKVLESASRLHCYGFNFVMCLFNPSLRSRARLNYNMNTRITMAETLIRL